MKPHLALIKLDLERFMREQGRIFEGAKARVEAGNWKNLDVPKKACGAVAKKLSETLENFEKLDGADRRTHEARDLLTLLVEWLEFIYAISVRTQSNYSQKLMNLLWRAHRVKRSAEG